MRDQESMREEHAQPVRVRASAIGECRCMSPLPWPAKLDVIHMLARSGCIGTGVIGRARARFPQPPATRERELDCRPVHAITSELPHTGTSSAVGVARARASRRACA